MILPNNSLYSPKSAQTAICHDTHLKSEQCVGSCWALILLMLSALISLFHFSHICCIHLLPVYTQITKSLGQESCLCSIFVQHLPPSN